MATLLPSEDQVLLALLNVRKPLRLYRNSAGSEVICLCECETDGDIPGPPDFTEIGLLPPLHPQQLGDADFLAQHRIKYPYIAGEMANGISTVKMVVEMGRAGMLGFFGSAGLPFNEVDTAIIQIGQALGSLGNAGCGASWGINLIHSPKDSALEDRIVDLFLQRKVRRVCASAFMAVSPAIVQYACSGLELRDGVIGRSNHLFAKISRPEVATQFMSPAPASMVQQLVGEGKLTRVEGELAMHVPLAEDVTAEADSGGHTDNRPLGALLPVILDLRDTLCSQYGYERRVRVGAAGGLGSPSSVAAAFTLGAAYVVTGSVNQSAIESGTSDDVRAMLARCGIADCVMAPAPDMFEQGMKVQVLKRGTLFAARATMLYQLYVSHDSLDSMPVSVQRKVEQDIFRASFDDVWNRTREYWVSRDPREIDRAAADPRHRMALMFRWYLGSASRWAQAAESDRAVDYQVWCGPAMGAFNRWVKGSFLEDPQQRAVVQIALNLLEGAAVVTRAQQLRASGVRVPDAAFNFQPRQFHHTDLYGSAS
ncbi:trans-AT polyketide synthase, acyltransferase and oxidoreductase domains [Paraburkholderia kururiensis]|uniref:PfaD family polyunsaturated fatty acid/polyketide biosynthesis protein n=1 Tax=Paraburkholderia kururiensis TaxID=984307 RepID=UPI0039A5070F